MIISGLKKNPSLVLGNAGSAREYHGIDLITDDLTNSRSKYKFGGLVGVHDVRCVAKVAIFFRFALARFFRDYVTSACLLFQVFDFFHASH